MSKEELEAQLAKMPNYLQMGSRVLDTHIETTKLIKLFYEYLENKKLDIEL